MGTYYKNFPILRYRCRNKGKRRVNHSTFSLLPYQLIPYVSFSVEYLFGIMLYYLTHSIKETLDKVAAETGRIMDAKALKRYRFLMEKALERLIISGLLLSYSEFLNYGFNYQSKYYPPIRGPGALGLDYYISQGSYFRNSWFLYGRASQFRY